MSNYQSELEVALQAVREAARVCQAVQREIDNDVLLKKDRSPVTVADFGSQALICRRLADALPADPVIAEEDARELRGSAELLARVVDHVGRIVPQTATEQVCDWIDHGNAQQYSARFWTLDPIDGTKGFLRGEQYAVSLSLIVDGHIRLGVLGCPNLPRVAGDTETAGALMWAIASGGAWSAALEPAADPVPLHVSSTSDSPQARFCESVEAAHSSHGDAAQVGRLLGMTAPSVRLDSQAKYAVVARGEADIYMRLPTRADYQEKIWDHAAGVLLVQEAGGRVTDVDGRALDFSQGSTLASNRGAVATNGELHEMTLEAIGSVLSAP